MAAEALIDHFQNKELKVSVCTTDIMIDGILFDTSYDLANAIFYFDLARRDLIKPGTYSITRKKS
jgi:hypothetical protein